MPDLYVNGMPGMRSAITADYRGVFRGGRYDMYLPGGKVIAGAYCRDPLNTGDETRLRAGRLMGMNATTGKFQCSIVGMSTAAYASAGAGADTTVTVSAVTATEIARLKTLGGGGNLSMLFVGPATAAGTVVSTAVTVTAVGATTITVGDNNVDKVTGSFLTLADGSGVPLTILPDGFPRKVTDVFGTSLDISFPDLPIGGVLISTQIVHWTTDAGAATDASLRAWIRTNLSTLSAGKFVFDDQYAILA